MSKPDPAQPSGEYRTVWACLRCGKDTVGDEGDHECRESRCTCGHFRIDPYHPERGCDCPCKPHRFEGADGRT